MKILKKVLLIGGIVFSCLLLLFFTYYFSVTASVRLEDEKLINDCYNMKIYDDEGAILSSGNSCANAVAYRQLPPALIHAFIATEDRKFFTHDGFDCKRIVKALITNLTTLSMKEGASTISQQLIKNTHLSGEKTIKRKLREIKLTRQLEKRYSKEDILLKYLNTIYFGHNLFGIQEATRFYFKKEVEDLSVDECAILAGLVKSPNNYSPFKHANKCLRRRNIVLGFMKEEGYIDETTYNEALNAPIPQKRSISGTDNSYCQFVYNEVEKILEEKGLDMSGQLHVYTYLNRNVQNQLAESLSSATTNKSGGILENATGKFIAFYSDVSNIFRTPASTIKPLAVYAPAIEENVVSLATPILDEPVDFGGYSPKNYDKRYHGYVSVREAMKKSYNVPAVKILNSLTVDKSKKYLKAMRLPLQKEDAHLAIALGGMSQGYPLHRLLSAYSVFPNGGKLVDGAFIDRIERNGEILYQRKITPARLFKQSTADLITDALKDTAKSGTAKKLRTLPFDVAAKTGTSGADNQVRDAYTISYTSGLTCGVWLGKENNEEIPYTGGGLPCDILTTLYEYLYNNFSPDYFENFSVSDETVRVRLDKYSLEKDGTLLQSDPFAPDEFVIEELFNKDTIPQNTSSIFSNPRIPAPIISYSDLKTTIIFDEQPPKFYQYKIEKTVDKKTSTIYQGDFLPVFIDDNLKKNKTYIYTITPYFSNIKGKPCILPSIITNEEKSQQSNPSIIKKPWWKY